MMCETFDARDFFECDVVSPPGDVQFLYPRVIKIHIYCKSSSSSYFGGMCSSAAAALHCLTLEECHIDALLRPPFPCARL